MHRYEALLTRRRCALNLAAVLMVAGCTPPGRPRLKVTAATPVPLDTAVLNTVDAVFAAAPSPGAERRVVVIDPLVDGIAGNQTRTTKQIQQRIADLVRDRYPQFELQPFSARTVAQSPIVLVGTLASVNGRNQTTGDRESFWFCLVMADLRSGKNVSRAVTWVRLAEVDTTPTQFFQDSPVWTDDPAIKSYVTSCQRSAVGDPISPAYLDGILTAAVVSNAIEAYDAGRYAEALSFYTDARDMPSGNQLRVLNGLYLTNWKLGRRQQATDSFGRLVDYGLDNNRLAMKLLFRPGSTAFSETARASSPYDMWLRQLAQRAARRPTCLEAVGNTSSTGSPALNNRLSVQRAEYVKDLLETENPALRGRLVANGVGAQDNLIGTGKDDESDALDRRVEFKVSRNCSA